MVLSQYVEASYADELLAGGQGAIGYLLKDRVSDIDDFLGALARVADGGTAMDPMVISTLMRRSRDPLESMTPREREVLGLMSQGLSNGSIAEPLKVTLVCVEKPTPRLIATTGLLTDDSAPRRWLAILQFLRCAP